MPAAFQQVSIDYAAVMPMFLVVAGALVGVLVEAFAPRARRHVLQVGLTCGTLVVALVVLVLWSRGHQSVTLGGSVAIDGVALFLQGTLLLLAVIGVLVMAERFGGSAPTPSPRWVPRPRARPRRPWPPVRATPPPRSSR
ncbi:hypothetical protein [Phycicoccus sp. HDW14]|uniref:hypothetical protein n=1 Tax=Phycicoccus sp. HDW14 TaxID=2714941 RepID=UPI003530466F